MKKLAYILLGFGICTLSVVAGGSDVAAQSRAAGCFLMPVKLGDADIDGFMATPAALNTLYPNGGFEMISRVRNLAGSSADTLDPMMSLIPQMTVSQRTALGSGLARTARACAAASPEYAQSIQEKVALANSAEVTAAFLSTLNEVQTAALGAAAANAGAGAATGVGGGAAGDTSGVLGGDSSVATASGDFTLGARARRLVTTTNITNVTEVVGTSPF